MGRVVKIVIWSFVVAAMVGAFAVFFLGINPFRSRPLFHQPPSSRDLFEVKLDENKLYTITIPEAVGRALGIRQGDKDAVAMASAPKQARPLVLPGSTAYDPSRVYRIRARFTPAKVVSIATVKEKRDPDVPSMDPVERELQPGDEVVPGMELGVFSSSDAGNKKNDLFEAIVQLRLDEVILKKAEDAGGALADIYLWTARRNVDTDRSAVRRARNTLLTWGVELKDIDKVRDEAMRLGIDKGRRVDPPEGDWTEKHDDWARIALKADFGQKDSADSKETAFLVERNVSKGEIVVDTTVNLFTIARTDQLLVYANCPEDYLPEFDRLQKAGQTQWRIQTVGAPKDGVECKFTEIGRMIDPNQHTAVIKGFIPNPGGKIRAGQYANAIVDLLAPQDVVEIPIDAMVEDGLQSIVFVQTNAKEHEYVMRRVEVVNRFATSAFVRSKPFPKPEELSEEDKKVFDLEQKQGLLPKEALKLNDVILKSGVMELKAHVIEKEAVRRSQNAKN